MKKSRILSLLTLIACLSSCGEAAGTTDTTASGDTSAAENTLPFEVRNFGGTEFTILSKAPEATASNEAWEAEETGDVICDAVYQRNRAVEEALNIKIMPFTLERNKMATEITTHMLAGDEVFQIGMVNYGTLQTLLSMENSMMPLSELSTLDADAAWWDAESRSAFAVGSTEYIISGALNLHTSTAIYGLFFNKLLIDELKLDSPYDLVNSGIWTMDKMYSMMQMAKRDLNGDNNWDDSDRYGLIATMNGFRYLAYAAGEEQIIKGADGKLEINRSQRLFDVFDKSLPIAFEHYEPEMYQSGNTGMMTFFAQNGALFYQSGLGNTTQLRDMDADFGIIPGPKLDEAQENYRAPLASSSVSMTIVPNFNSDPERTGIILNALGYYSQEIVTPAFYDSVLSSKLTRDEESLEMLEIMYDNKMYVINDVFNFGKSQGILTSMGKSGINDYATRLAAVESAIQAALDAFNGD